MNTLGRFVREDGEPVPKWVDDDLQAAYLCLRGPQLAQRMWDRVLTTQERERLDGDLNTAYTKYHGAIGMWMRLHKLSLPQSIVTLGYRIGTFNSQTSQRLLQELGLFSEDQESAMYLAIKGRGLVINEDARSVWWRGQAVALDWSKHNSLWALFSELARQAKAGLGVDRFSLPLKSEAPTHLTKLRSRLKKTPGFPSDLDSEIDRSGPGTYRLKVSPENINIFVRFSHEQIQEWTIDDAMIRGGRF